MLCTLPIWVLCMFSKSFAHYPSICKKYCYRSFLCLWFLLKPTDLPRQIALSWRDRFDKLLCDTTCMIDMCILLSNLQILSAEGQLPPWLWAWSHLKWGLLFHQQTAKAANREVTLRLAADNLRGAWNLPQRASLPKGVNCKAASKRKEQHA